MLGEKIKDFRKSKHMTRLELSKKTGISTMSLLKYEHNTVFPTVPNLYKIAVALECDYDELYLVLQAEKRQRKAEKGLKS